MKTLKSTLALIGCMLCLVGTANATIVRSMNVKQMQSRADVIVRGVVLERKASWDASKSRIYTVTTLRVDEALKGTKQATLQIRQIGGTVDGISQRVVGNAQFKVGEEVVVFLTQDTHKSLHYVIGMAQGKFSVDRSGATPLVTRALTGLALADVKDGELHHLAHTEAPTSAPTLDAFRKQLAQP